MSDLVTRCCSCGDVRTTENDDAVIVAECPPCAATRTEKITKIRQRSAEMRNEFRDLVEFARAKRHAEERYEAAMLAYADACEEMDRWCAAPSDRKGEP